MRSQLTSVEVNTMMVEDSPLLVSSCQMDGANGPESSLEQVLFSNSSLTTNSTQIQS